MLTTMMPVGSLKASITQETAFVLGNTAGKKGNKQHEIDMSNANPRRMLLNPTTFHLLTLRIALG